MELSEIRTWFIEITGRNDLLSLGPNGRPKADFFIQAGQDFLDRRYNFPADRAVVTVSLEPGAYTADLTNVRAVKRVWVSPPGSGPIYLRKESLEELRRRLDDEADFSEVQRGTPAYYAIGVPRSTTPSLLDETVKRIVFLSPADVVMDLHVEALLLSPKLDSDNSVSFWTSIMPQTLIQASWMMVERFYRNTEGVMDHLRAIEEDVLQLDFDQVEEDIAGIYQMKNSWGGNYE